MLTRYSTVQPGPPGTRVLNPWPLTYLNLIFLFRMCSIQASIKAVMVTLRAWTRASSDRGATASRTWPITVWAARDAYSLGVLGKPGHQQTCSPFSKKLFRNIWCETFTLLFIGFKIKCLITPWCGKINFRSQRKNTLAQRKILPEHLTLVFLDPVFRFSIGLNFNGDKMRMKWDTIKASEFVYSHQQSCSERRTAE